MTDPASCFGPRFPELLRLALEEDAVARDVTTTLVVPAHVRGTGRLKAKAAGVVAGLPLLAASSPLWRWFPSLSAEVLRRDGESVSPGDVVAVLRGSGRELLSAERTILNFLQRMSGVATATATYVRAVAGTRARIQETRKTCPGWRDLDKYAVRAAGGLNHRADLSAQVLIKENHLVFAGVERSPEAVRKAVADARAAIPEGMVLEVEVETLDQLDAALDAAADVILLDNMTPALHAEAVRRRDARRSPALLEASGGITLESVRAVAAAGVDRISVGALTHSVQALDLSLDLVPDAAAS
jgi:nicotinate-nucleotide pyrophosphorylase (carboxylating)